jgi:hypothetical protein
VDEECVEDCDLDDQEPNDDADADPVQVGEDARVQLDDLTVCRGDEDWFPVEVGSAREQLSANLVQRGVRPVLRLEILNTDGETVLAETEESGRRRNAIAAVPAPGIYFVRVSAVDEVSPGGMSYSLTITRTSPERCVPDGFEPNESRDAARSIRSGNHDGRLCRFDGDADWFSFPTELGDVVDIVLTYDHDLILPDPYLGAVLYAPDDAQYALTRDGDSDDDVLQGGAFLISDADEGEWYLWLEGSQDGVSLDYELELSIEGRPMACGEPDANEPNETCGDAATLPLNTSLAGFACGPEQDEDWFRVTVPEDGQDLEVRMEHFHFDGNLELELRTLEGVLIDLSYEAGPNVEVVNLEDADAGDYCVKVFPRSRLTENRYTVSAEVE